MCSYQYTSRACGWIGQIGSLLEISPRIGRAPAYWSGAGLSRVEARSPQLQHSGARGCTYYRSKQEPNLRAPVNGEWAMDQVLKGPLCLEILWSGRIP